MHFLLPVAVFMSVKLAFATPANLKTVRQAATNGHEKGTIIWMCSGDEKAIPGEFDLASLDSVNWS